VSGKSKKVRTKSAGARFKVRIRECSEETNFCRACGS
jgi:hypothetical protein